MRRKQQESDMTPMIDVTFLILIFFMVTASFSTKRAIETPIPNSDQASETVIVLDQSTDSLRLHVTQDGSFLLMATNWQKELVGKQSLVSELAVARTSATAALDLNIEVESKAKLQTLVDAMDAATIAGFDHYHLSEIDAELI